MARWWGSPPAARSGTPQFGEIQFVDEGYAVDVVSEDLLLIGRTDEEAETIWRWMAHLEKVLDTLALGPSGPARDTARRSHRASLIMMPSFGCCTRLL